MQEEKDLDLKERRQFAEKQTDLLLKWFAPDKVWGPTETILDFRNGTLDYGVLREKIRGKEHFVADLMGWPRDYHGAILMALEVLQILYYFRGQSGEISRIKNFMRRIAGVLEERYD